MNRKPKLILRQLKHLSQIEPNDEASGRAIAHARARLAQLAAEPARPIPRNLVTTFFRSLNMSSRIAAAVVVCAAAVAILVVFTVPGGQGPFAFAQVIEKVQQTKSLSFKGKEYKPGSTESIEVRVLITADDKARIELPGSYSIQDTKAHRMMTVDTKNKTVRMVENYSSPSPEAESFNPYEMLKNARQDALERLPDEEIQGRKTHVFRIDMKHLRDMGENPTCKAWIDPKTSLPIQIERTSTDGKEACVLYDIEFDRPIDPSMLSFTPPKGYSVQTIGSANFPDLPKEPELRAPEIIPGVGLGAIRFGMSREEIESRIGKPDAYEANDTSLVYNSRGFTLMVSKRKGLTTIQCLSQILNIQRVREFAGKTKEGIGIGSSLGEVEKVFGKANRDEGHNAMNKRLVYSKNGLTIQFVQDKVIRIDMSEVSTPASEPSNKNGSPAKQGEQASSKSMRINVVGPDGKPMAGAKILAAIWSKELSAEKKNREYTSDASGRATIEFPKTFDILRLFTSCDGYVPLFTHWEQLDENPPEDFTIKLTKGTVIGGLVKNEEGQPIAGAKVEVSLSMDHSEDLKRTSFTHWLATGDDARTTDAEGRWTLNNVPPGNAKVLVKITHPNHIGDTDWGGLQKSQGISLQSLRDQKATILLHRKK